MRYSKILLVIIILLFALLASCARNNAEVKPTYLPTATVPVVDYSIPATQFFQEAQATIDARTTASIEEAQVLATQTAAQQLAQGSATADLLSQETAQAMPIFTRIEQLYATGALTSTQGTYYRLPDFEDQWALRDYYDMLLTDHTVSDFVVSSTVEWESAGTNVDFWNAGCGFVFRLNARGDHYLAFLGSDGWAHLYLALNHNLEQIGQGRYSDTVVLTGKATILLSAQVERITLLVNDVQILQVKDRTLSTGFLGHAIASGTNAEYGTLCRMTDNELWNLETP